MPPPSSAAATGVTAVWVDGAIADPDGRHVSVTDHGFVVGDGVFETLKVVRGQPFAARRHLERLRRSAAALRLDVPPDDVLRAAMAEVVAAAGLGDGPGKLRVTVTGGPGPIGSLRGNAPPSVVVVGGPLAALPATASVITVQWPRNERGALAGVKSTSYAENVRALQLAADAAADEAIFPNLAGDLCEGTGSNVFLVRGGRLVTPPLSSGCLAGVTRSLLCELADIAELDVPIGALAAADEAFLASTTRAVQPITSVDGRPLPRGAVTRDVARMLQVVEETRLDP